MFKSIKSLGSIGIISDTDPRSLPENAFTTGNNVRFVDNDIEKSKGESEVFTTPAIDPYWLLPVQTESIYYWVYPSLTECYVTDGTTNTPITRVEASKSVSGITRSGTTATATSTAHGYSNSDIVSIEGADQADYNITATISNITANTFDYTVANSPTTPATGTILAYKNDLYAATADIGWNGGNIGNVPIINNGVDDPQMWNPVGTGQKLTSLTWASGQTWSDQSKIARVIRPFQQALIAMDCTESGTRYRQRIRWSHPSDSGAVPSTWDETDTTKDAGYYDLEAGGGNVVDGLPLRDTFIIYKDNKTIGMQRIGGAAVYRFYDIFEETGILSRRCVKAFFGKHFVVTNGDVIVHDGNTFDSVINHRKKRELFALIDATNYQRTFVSPNYQKNEMWICFPKTGSSFADTAYIWNFKDDTWTVRDLPTVKHIGYGLVDPNEADTWASTTDTWDLVEGSWGELSYSPTIIKNLMAGSTKFYLADDTEQTDGSNITAYIEREGLDFGNASHVKRITRVWPRIECSGDITFYVGQQMTSTDAVTWTAYTYSSGDDKIDVDVTGRLLGYRIESNTNVSWSAQDLDFEYTVRGRY